MNPNYKIAINAGFGEYYASCCSTFSESEFSQIITAYNAGFCVHTAMCCGSLTSEEFTRFFKGYKKCKCKL